LERFRAVKSEDAGQWLQISAATCSSEKDQLAYMEFRDRTLQYCCDQQDLAEPKAAILEALVDKL
jgi:hypothetical protein